MAQAWIEYPNYKSKCEILKCYSYQCSTQCSRRDRSL